MVYFWAFYSTPSVCMSVCFDYCSFVAVLKSGSMRPPTLFLFFKVVLTIQVPWNSKWILDGFFYFYKKCHWDFNRNYTESVGCFGQYWHLNHIVFQSMNMRCHSMYCCLLYLLSAVLCSFQCTSLSPPWLRLFLSTHSFWWYCKWILKLGLKRPYNFFYHLLGRLLPQNKTSRLAWQGHMA